MVKRLGEMSKWSDHHGLADRRMSRVERQTNWDGVVGLSVFCNSGTCCVVSPTVVVMRQAAKVAGVAEVQEDARHARGALAVDRVKMSSAWT